jgi:Domain of unknown function (DUF4278)
MSRQIMPVRSIDSNAPAKLTDTGALVCGTFTILLPLVLLLVVMRRRHHQRLSQARIDQLERSWQLKSSQHPDHAQNNSSIPSPRVANPQSHYRGTPHQAHSNQRPTPGSSAPARTSSSKVRLMYRGHTYGVEPLPQLSPQVAGDPQTVTLTYRGQAYQCQIPQVKHIQRPRAINWWRQFDAPA